jgi:uncharacterized protein (TIGR04255 family)
VHFVDILQGYTYNSLRVHKMNDVNSNGCVQKALPSYRKPPVNEVYCGVRFRTPEKLKVTHFGLLWEKFSSMYPKIEHAVPIQSIRGQVLLDSSTGLLLPRVWFINELDNKLVQFQVDQLYFNWRQRGDDYPRYGEIMTGFEEVVRIVEEFFHKQSLGEFEPTEYQLTFTNNIPNGEGWDEIRDINRVFRDFVWKSGERFLPDPMNIAWNANFELPDSKGNLNIKLSQGTELKDGSKKLLILELKARGLVERFGKAVSMRQWYDLAHEWIVRGFTDITTPEMHTRWEREDA